MTTTLKSTRATTYANSRGVRVIFNSEVDLSGNAYEEAEQARRAFEQVLLPRFTRDEAIALAVTALKALHAQGSEAWHPRGAARALLEALAAAGVFSDHQHGGAHLMADKLDAAGIR